MHRTNTESNRQSRETDNTGGRRQTRNQIDNPEKLTTQVHRTNTESNRQSRETDNTGGRRQTRNQIDNPEKLTTQVDEDKHGIK